MVHWVSKIIGDNDFERTLIHCLFFSHESPEHPTLTLTPPYIIGRKCDHGKHIYRHSKHDGDAILDIVLPCGPDDPVHWKRPGVLPYVNLCYFSTISVFLIFLLVNVSDPLPITRSSVRAFLFSAHHMQQRACISFLFFGRLHCLVFLTRSRFGVHVNSCHVILAQMES